MSASRIISEVSAFQGSFVCILRWYSATSEVSVRPGGVPL